ncbi:hypothetical protein IAI18_14785 [Acetobacteraceae bacterium H6797]|nr:hypothetical protein [Acetobacteraceae bacterium H6797]
MAVAMGSAEQHAGAHREGADREDRQQGQRAIGGGEFLAMERDAFGDRGGEAVRQADGSGEIGPFEGHVEMAGIVIGEGDAIGAGGDGAMQGVGEDEIRAA